MTFILEMPYDSFIELIHNAFEKDVEAMLWEKWLVELPNMDKSTFIPFEEYKQKHFKQESTKTDDEILQDAENILKSMSRK